MFGSWPGLCMCLIKHTQVSEPFMVAGTEPVKISHLREKNPVIFHQLLMLEGGFIPYLLCPHWHAELDSLVSCLTLGVLSYSALSPKVSPPSDQAQLSRPFLNNPLPGFSRGESSHKVKFACRFSIPAHLPPHFAHKLKMLPSMAVVVTANTTPQQLKNPYLNQDF